jgi:hypothetical protein
MTLFKVSGTKFPVDGTEPGTGYIASAVRNGRRSGIRPLAGEGQATAHPFSL